MEHRIGFAPFVIYEPYPVHVKATTPVPVGRFIDYAIEYYWYDGKVMRYQRPGIDYLGPHTYKVVRYGL